MDRHPQPIDKQIKRARERLRWTQAQLGRAIGVTQKTIDNWEHDKTYPKSSIGALEEVLGIRLEGEPATAELALSDATDEWELSVIRDPDLPPDLKRALIEDSRAARSAYDAARRARRQRRAEAERQAAAG